MFINNFILEICEKKRKRIHRIWTWNLQFTALAPYIYDHAKFLHIMFINVVHNAYGKLYLNN